MALSAATFGELKKGNIMDKKQPDLTFVDPHKRALVAARIKAVKRFNENPGRATAEREAKALGISAARFYLVVKAWNTFHDASKLPGANRHRMSNRVPEEIRQEIARLIAADPDLIPERIIERVGKFINAQKLKPLSGPTIADELNRQRRGYLPHIEQNVNYALDHCHLAIPVSGEREASSVTLSAVIEVDRKAIIGLAFTHDEPTASSSAKAISRATSAGLLQSGASILIDRPDTPEWRKLVRLLVGAGISAKGETLNEDAFFHDRGVLRKRGNGRLLRAISGRYIGGYPMAIRTMGSRRKPAPLGRVGAPALSLEEAECLVRSRVVAEDPEQSESELSRLAGKLKLQFG